MRDPLPLATHDLLAKAACLLFINGQSSENTGSCISRLGAALGVKADLLLRWGEVVLFVEGHAAPMICKARPTGVDMGRVNAVLDVVAEVEAGRMDNLKADAALDAISRMPAVNVFRFAILAGAGAGALGVIFGAHEPITLGIIFASAFFGAFLRRGVSHVSVNPLLQPFVAALLAGMVGAFAIQAGWGVDPRLVLVCPCMVLVPGPHVLNGTIDLARARLTIGMARLTFAGLLVLMICAGLLLGLTVADIDLPTTSSPVNVPWLHDVVAAGIAVAAYGTFFNMSWRMLPVPIIVGMTAHGAHWLLLDWGTSIASASLAACFIVGVLISPLADRLRHPFAAFAFSSVVSMVPGVFLFDAAAALVELTAQGNSASPTLLVEGAVSSINALLIILAMTVGLIVPKMVYASHQESRMKKAGKLSPEH